MEENPKFNGRYKMYNTRRNTRNSNYLKYSFGLPFLDSDTDVDCFTDDSMTILPAEFDRITKFTDSMFSKIHFSGLRVCS